MNFRDSRIKIIPEIIENLYNPLCNNLLPNITQPIVVKLINRE